MLKREPVVFDIELIVELIYTSIVLVNVFVAELMVLELMVLELMIVSKANIIYTIHDC